MPPFSIRVLATLFIGLPGACLWLGGLLMTGFGAAAIAEIKRIEHPELLLCLAAAILSMIVGSIMIKGWELFIRGNRHSLSPGQMAKIMAIALSGQTLAVTALCLLVVAALQIMEKDLPAGWFTLAAALAGLAGSIPLHRLGFALRLGWQKEHCASRIYRRKLEMDALPPDKAS